MRQEFVVVLQQSGGDEAALDGVADGQSLFVVAVDVVAGRAVNDAATYRVREGDVGARQRILHFAYRIRVNLATYTQPCSVFGLVATDMSDYFSLQSTNDYSVITRRRNPYKLFVNHCRIKARKKFLL